MKILILRTPYSLSAQGHDRGIKFNPLQWSKVEMTFILIQQSAKINPGKNHLKIFTYIFVLAEIMKC